MSALGLLVSSTECRFFRLWAEATWQSAQIKPTITNANKALFILISVLKHVTDEFT
jgi:hypothetical protein